MGKHMAREMTPQERAAAIVPVKLCSSFDEDCFLMTDEQHEMCAKSLPMYCETTGEYCGEFNPKDGHCPFERA